MLFPNVSGELVESLYLKWGGIARYVLKHALVKEQQDLLVKALEVSNIDSVVAVSMKNRNNLIKFLSAAEEIGETGQLRGILFEKYAHTVIAKGGSFKIRDLRTGSESTLQLPMDLTTLLFSNNSQVQNATNCYFRPISNTFESVDSFIKPNLLFQMTCQRSSLQTGWAL
ncbi:hypothetical protein BSLG_005855 [Batrachochytrium salamandrivorans]|nr:hypothetical protein BSLG_005855 [Batrachochytrium salamandrivorans]